MCLRAVKSEASKSACLYSTALQEHNRPFPIQYNKDLPFFMWNDVRGIYLAYRLKIPPAKNHAVQYIIVVM